MKYALLSAVLASAGGAALLAMSAQGQSITAAGAVTQASVPEKADNFRLTDQYSKSHELRYFKSAPAIVLISHANGSEHVRAAAPAIEAMRARYAEKGVAFFFINSTPGDSREAIAADAAAAGITAPVLIDSTQLIGENLGISRTAQAFVIDPRTWRIVYNGPIDDRFADRKVKSAAAPKDAWLQSAIDDLIAGRAVKTASVDLKTPEIAFPERARKAEFAKISYAKDVAPILEANCVACHSAGGIAPFAMTSYETVKGFAPMIR